MQAKKRPVAAQQAVAANATRTRASRASSAAPGKQTGAARTAAAVPVTRKMAAPAARKTSLAKRKVAAPVGVAAGSAPAKPAAPRVKAPRGPSTEALVMKPGKAAEKHAGKRTDPVAEKGDDKRSKPGTVAKLVRDSFTMPEVEFAQIAALKERAIRFGRPAKKSELLRAGLKVLCGLDDATLRATLDSLAPLKPGRPRKS